MPAQAAKNAQFRNDLWNVLQHGHGRTGRAYTFISAVFIILSISILPLEFISALQQYHNMLIVVEVVLTVIFTTDYVMRIYSAPHRWKYVFSFFGLVDLFAILPFFLGLLGTQYLRALRLIRLVRFGEFQAAANEEEREMMEGIGLTEGEHIEHVISHHPIYLLFNVIPSIAATTAGIAVMLAFHGHPFSVAVGVILLLFAIIFFWRTWLNFSYDVIYVTTHRLIFYDQYLLGRTINQINYHVITNVQPSMRSVLGYIFRYGQLTIETPATEQGHIELNIVRQHEKSAQIIMRKCLGHLRQMDHHHQAPPESGR